MLTFVTMRFIHEKIESKILLFYPFLFIMNLLIQIILMAAAVVIAAYLIPGVEVVSFRWAIIVAIVIALLNATV
jgi:hypothetical protein